MPAVLAITALLAAAMPFGDAVTDGELAGVASISSPPIEHLAPTRLYVEPPRLATGEAIDCWWAYDGAAMIAEAVRPTPTVPAWLDGARLGAGSLSIDLRIEISSATRG